MFEDDHIEMSFPSLFSPPFFFPPPPPFPPPQYLVTAGHVVDGVPPLRFRDYHENCWKNDRLAFPLSFLFFFLSLPFPPLPSGGKFEANQFSNSSFPLNCMRFHSVNYRTCGTPTLFFFSLFLSLPFDVIIFKHSSAFRELETQKNNGTTGAFLFFLFFPSLSPYGSSCDKHGYSFGRMRIRTNHHVSFSLFFSSLLPAAALEQVASHARKGRIARGSVLSFLSSPFFFPAQPTLRRHPPPFSTSDCLRTRRQMFREAREFLFPPSCAFHKPTSERLFWERDTGLILILGSPFFPFFFFFSLLFLRAGLVRPKASLCLNSHRSHRALRRPFSPFFFPPFNKVVHEFEKFHPPAGEGITSIVRASPLSFPSSRPPEIRYILGSGGQMD